MNRTIEQLVTEIKTYLTEEEVKSAEQYMQQLYSHLNSKSKPYQEELYNQLQRRLTTPIKTKYSENW